MTPKNVFAEEMKNRIEENMEAEKKHGNGFGTKCYKASLKE